MIDIRKDLYPGPFIIVDRVDLNQIAYNLCLLRNLAHSWSAERPAMNASNRDLRKTILLMNGEAQEASEALHAYETVEGLSNPESLQSLLMELFDIAVFVFSLFENSGIPFDGARIVGKVNGTGRSSGVLEDIQRYGRNINPEELQSFDILHQVLIDVLSAVNNLGSSGVFAQVIIQAMAKNKRNYPPEFFSKRDPLNPKKILLLEELLQKCRHAIAALRMIRGVHGDPIRGLAPEFVAPHQGLIQAYRNSPVALAALESRLKPTL